MTAALTNAAMLPLWWRSGRYVRQRLQNREFPLLALGSAFSFTIMLFNIPALGGTTAHAIGGTLLAILLGPRSALLGISLTLAIQALLFGDGGIWAFGANCLSMAFAMPYVGYGVYRVLLLLRPQNTSWKAISAGIGAYVGINVAALLVAVLLGVQPLLAHTSDGTPLYFPFGLSITLPAMLGTHLIVAGPLESVVTGLVVTYALRAKMPLYQFAVPQAPAHSHKRWLWATLLGLVLLSPLGLLAQGEAWGEWSSEGIQQEITKRTGNTFLPQGLAQAESVAYKGIHGLQDYAGEYGTWGYIGSGLLGSGVLVGATLLLGKRRPKPIPSLPIIVNTSTVVPAWLLTPNPPAPTQTRGAHAYLERTLSQFNTLWERQSAQNIHAHDRGLLQQRDPRCKLLCAIALIGIVNSSRSPLFHSLNLLLLLYITHASHLRLRDLWRRYGGLFLLFGVALAAPMLSFTANGISIALILLVRLASVLWIAFCLTSTTAPMNLILGLQKLRVPSIAISLLALTYRYLNLLLQTASEMFLARKSRTVGRESGTSGRHFIGFSIASLFGKTVHTAEEIHLAMVSRGFQGNFPSLTRLHWSGKDTLYLLSVLLWGGITWLLH